MKKDPVSRIFFLGIDKVDAPEENEGSFSSDCKFSCALNSARPENLSGMKNSSAGASAAPEFFSSATYTPPPAD